MSVSSSTLYPFTPSDLRVLADHGISPLTATGQLENLKSGFPFLKLQSSATPGAGIEVLDPATEELAIARWQKYLSDGGKVTKFVPASGAASRMFKALFSFVEGQNEEPAPGSPVAEIITRASELPFIAELDKTCSRLYGLTARELIDAKRYKDFIKAIIYPEGLNYGKLPKAMLTFHDYGADQTRTPLEEQLAEGAQTATNADGTVNLHFTVSAEHRHLFEDKLAKAIPAMEQRYGVKYHISLSEQKPSTDTLAGDAAHPGEPFRDSNGNLVFRPGGHGALIENLNDLDSTVVFIKNIDNVVPETLRESTVRYKRILGGVLLMNRDRIAGYIGILRQDTLPTTAQLEEMITFATGTLSISHLGITASSPEKARTRLLEIFERPLRVCGMVRNDGEPGGGPYLAFNPDGTASPQILESTQIDKNDVRAMEMMSKATHFNPVDLVCYIRDSEDKPFDLTRHTDPATGFISSKSYEGRELLALELPGLWNGAMSDWNTIFVEVPADTFNPVKTVNDLLRPAHQVHAK